MEISLKKIRETGAPVLTERAGVPFLRFAGLEATGFVDAVFTTRLGGASRGCFSSMNLSFTRGDDTADVIRNYDIMSEAMGIDLKAAVLSHQTHTVNVRRVTKADCGRGITKDKGWSDVDGLITDEPGVPLITFYADCVPLYFVDPVHKAIGLSHSGWRGTVNRMGAVTLAAMKEAFGTDPADVHCAIGPSICKECYEVGGEVAEEFAKAFAGREEEILTAKENGKFLLDLHGANEIVLTEAGVLPEHIEVTQYCTRCNPEVFYSHRIQGNARGNCSAILSIKEE